MDGDFTTTDTRLIAVYALGIAVLAIWLVGRLRRDVERKFKKISNAAALEVDE